MTKPKDPTATALAAVTRATAKAIGTADPEAVTPDQVAAVQEAVANLRNLERDLSIALGKREGAIQGNLKDGRQFTLKRTADRKAWDHEEWKRDARRAIVRHTTDEMGATVQVLTEGGEVQDFDLARLLHLAITEAQEVHGSTAPRSTALKRLGLYATDYCESSPGGWKFDAIKPEPADQPTTPTTQKDA